MSIARTIRRLGTGSYTVTRSASAPVYVDGLLQAPTTTTLTIEAAVQPLSGRERLMMSEALRDRETKNLWTTTRLRTATPSQRADKVSIDGDSYTVMILEEWPVRGGYYKAIVAKES